MASVAPALLAPAATSAVRREVGEPGERAERELRLRRRLTAEARQAPASMAAIFWENLESGERVAIRPDHVFRSASLVKLPVAAAALSRWEQEPSARTPYLEQQLWKMIAESDNAAVDVLAEHAGGLGAVNRFCRDHGWGETEMNYYFRDWRSRRRHNFTSARDMAAFLRAVDHGELVSSQASEEIWRIMLDQQLRQRIPAGIPASAGAEVASKTGTLLSVLHDVAIIRASGTRYLLCLLTANPRSEGAGDAWCRRVSRIVWEEMMR